MKTLLELAKEVKIKHRTGLSQNATSEEIELAIAWAKDEITLGQVSTVLFGEKTAKSIGGRTLYTIACLLRAGIRKGIIKV